MMKRTRGFIFSKICRRLHWIALAFFVLPGLVGCQDSSSRTTNKDNTSLQKNSGDATADQITYYDHSESFVAEALEVKAVGKPVHMLWAVAAAGTSYGEQAVRRLKSSLPDYDASGKNMADEIEAINKHLPLLIKSLKEVSAVQTTLMSELMTEDRIRKYGYSGAILNRGVMEINGIHTRLLGETSEFRVWSSPITYLLHYVIDTATDCSAAYTYTLRCHPSEDFFRDPKALKVMIVVRDRGVPSRYKENFEGTFPESEKYLADLKRFSADLSSFRFFALIDLRDSYLNKSCDKNDPDRRHCNYFYTHLVEELGGEKYHTNNISSSEWSKVFDQLKSKIVEEIGGESGEKTQKATFTLQRPASKILEVKVEGQALAKTSFQVTGNTLYIDAEHVSEGQNIVVKYQSTQST